MKGRSLEIEDIRRSMERNGKMEKTSVAITGIGGIG